MEDILGFISVSHKFSVFTNQQIMRSSFVVAISGLVALAGVVFGSSGMLYNIIMPCTHACWSSC